MVLISKENILKYIPQREPFVMIDSILEVKNNEFHTEKLWEESNLFNREGFISESGLTEFIAQSCAAGFGYQQSLSEGGEAKIGFIGAISKWELSELPPILSTTECKISVLTQFENIQLVEGQVFYNNKMILECQLKIVLT
ncbi:MAG: hypothetical protein HYU67_06315 [Flavobacteriia bacterium]|nr:hypothetical protein [Flavobacteriia bacterium]